jgi:hypothetical protein
MNNVYISKEAKEAKEPMTLDELKKKAGTWFEMD